VILVGIAGMVSGRNLAAPGGRGLAAPGGSPEAGRSRLYPVDAAAGRTARGDGVILESLRRREPEVLDDLLAAYGRELQATAYLILRDRADAEDVVVQTLLTAWDKGAAIRDEAAVRAWLYRVATNHALRLRRSGARVVRLTVVPDDPAPFDLARQSADRVALLAAIDELPLRTRAAVVLHYYADLSVADVAVAMGTSPNTVKTQLREALERLRHRFAEPNPEARHA
jgi:RNA polymerase sigma factor (sigma-70 family)